MKTIIELREEAIKQDKNIEFYLYQLLEEKTYLYNKLSTESKYTIERLNKENNDLRKLYQRTYKHLFEKGNDELARYFQAQIDECSTFYVEPIVDYYEETKRLNNIITELEKWLEENAFIQEQDFIDRILVPNNDKIIYVDDILEKLQELKGSDK